MQQGRYLLSLKDMNRSDALEDLLKAGVTSFKIEGRLKDMAYVQNIVGHYRRKLDIALKNLNLSRTSSGTIRLDFEPQPQKTFNRGSTPYFLTARHCGSSASLSDYSQWVFHFNYESFSCEDPLEDPPSYTISGSSFLAQAPDGTAQNPVGDRSWRGHPAVEAPSARPCCSHWPRAAVVSAPVCLPPRSSASFFHASRSFVIAIVSSLHSYWSFCTSAIKFITVNRATTRSPSRCIGA